MFLEREAVSEESSVNVPSSLPAGSSDPRQREPDRLFELKTYTLDFRNTKADKQIHLQDRVLEGSFA